MRVWCAISKAIERFNDWSGPAAEKRLRRKRCLGPLV
jgi:hypothetical protein